MRISDWSSDVCSADLLAGPGASRPPAIGISVLLADQERCRASSGAPVQVSGLRIARLDRPQPRGGQPDGGAYGQGSVCGRAVCALGVHVTALDASRGSFGRAAYGLAGVGSPVAQPRRHQGQASLGGAFLYDL